MGFMNTANKKLQTTYNAKSEGSVGDSLFVRTGIDVIDYYLGTEINSEDGDFYNLGIPQGKIVKFIGHSQSGKTTLALQIADATVKELNGDVVVFDFERSSSDMRSRYKAITGCTDEEYDERFTLFKNPTMSVDDVKEYIFTIAKQKQEAGKKCMVEWVNLEGATNKIYPPTVIIIDSWAVVRNKEILNDAKLDGNMVAASIAKSNGAFLTSIEHLLEEYNISLFIINHITTKISINPYAAKKIQLPGLGDDENLPGGNKGIFLASYILRLTAGAELPEDKEFGIKGRIVNLQLLKTRSGYNIKKIPLVYTAKKGFSNILTNYWHIKENKLLKPAGSKGSALQNLPNKPFAMNKFYKNYITDEEIKNATDELAENLLAKILQDKAGDFLALDIKEVDELTEDFEG